MEMVAPGVRMLSVSRVIPVPAPAGSDKVKLSFLDAPWVATPPVQEVFLYEMAGGDEFAAVVRRLKESLASALALYLPLAGELAIVEGTRDMVVDCSQPGVAFLEAEAITGCIEVRRLAHDVSATEVVGLLPEHDAWVLPAPVLTVQATRLNAGLALAVSVHHAVVDGRAFYMFLEAWSSISRGESPGALPEPEYVREAITHAHPCSDELARDVLSTVAPNLPQANVMDGYLSQHSRMARRTFVLGADGIRTLKERIDRLASSATTTTEAVMAKPVSTFVALSALSWTAFVRAKGLAAGEDTHLLFQADLRARLGPPVGARYFGNCVRGCIASADAGELVGEAGLLHASRAIQAAVREARAAALAGMGTWIRRAKGLPAARQVFVGGSPLFRVHKLADFGFGMADKVVPVYIPGSPETAAGSVDDGVSMDDHGGGRIVLSGGKREGDVHLSVSLGPGLMNAFKNHIDSTPIRSKF